MTQADLIRGALMELGAVAAGEPVSPEEMADAAVILAGMIDSWQAEELYIYTQKPHKFRLTAGKQTYTLGVNGDFNMARPSRIERITMVDDVNNAAQPLELPLDNITRAQWAAIPVKSVQNQYPGKVWDDEGYPQRTLSYWPVPTLSIQTAIYTWEPLATFNGPQDNPVFPPGYQECLRYNLAMRLAPAWNAQPSPALVQQANEARDRVKTMNQELVDLRCDPAVATSDNRLFAWIDFISGR